MPAKVGVSDLQISMTVSSCMTWTSQDRYPFTSSRCMIILKDYDKENVTYVAEALLFLSITYCAYNSFRNE